MSTVKTVNMAGFVRSRLFSLKNSILSSTYRVISSTRPLNIKEIRQRQEGSTIVVEGVTVPSPRTELLVRAERLDPAVQPLETSCDDGSKKQPCYLCALQLDVKHTDVLILSQFVRSDGCMLPRRITGLCSRQQKKMGKMVSMAQKAGLMINLTPEKCNKDPKKRRDYKKFNTYFDEKTIFMRRIPNQNDKWKR